MKRGGITKAVEDLLAGVRTLTIINNLADGVVSTDGEGVINLYNAACLNLLDTNDSLNGKHIDDVLALYDVEDKPFSVFKQLKKLTKVTKREDLRYKFDEDDIMRLEVTSSPIRSSYSRSKHGETHDGYIIILRDITKAKSLEEERDEFISVVSHELRTPIAITEGTISNVQAMMGHPNTTQEMLEDAVTTAHEQIVFLASMVNDLSTLSRAERGVADETELIDIKELIAALHDKYHKEATAKKLQLDMDVGPKVGQVSVSRLYLEELLQNFITNSIKYTKQGSVKIIARQKSNKVTISVKDTGIGISKSEHKKVFDKFYRSEDYRTRETGGSGLGLYIGAKLARKLHTKIDIVSRLNHGSTFSITLPVAEPESGDPSK
jgi:two-component system phosphate regulon sensor histidine kinase PhoR